MDSTLTSPAQPTAPLAASLPAGTVIAGRFTLQSLAGRGSMGAVYRATDSLSGQSVALKLLHPSPHPDSSRRFTREAEFLSSLRHPGIVSYVAHGLTDSGFPFLAMQWLEGEDLSQRLTRQPLSLEQTLTLLRHATLALSAAHQQGAIHRDLKPSNLFLRAGRPEDVVLLDFGLARHTLPSAALTASQMVIGTPGYMAPEQVSHQAPLTPATHRTNGGAVEGGGLERRGRGGPLTGAARAVRQAGAEAAQPLGVHAGPGHPPMRCAAGAWLSWLERLGPQHHAA